MWVGFLISHLGKDEVEEVFEILSKQVTSENEAQCQAYSEITKILVCRSFFHHLLNGGWVDCRMIFEQTHNPL